MQKNTHIARPLHTTTIVFSGAACLGIPNAALLVRAMLEIHHLALDLTRSRFGGAGSSSSTFSFEEACLPLALLLLLAFPLGEAFGVAPGDCLILLSNYT